MIKYKGIAPPTFMELNGKNYLMPGFTEVPHSCGVHNWNDYIVWKKLKVKILQVISGQLKVHQLLEYFIL